MFEVPHLRDVARHAAPHLVEATFVPLVLFYGALWVAGVWWALAAALVWSCAALGRRILLGRGVPGILVLGTVGLTVRTVISLLSGSVFIYFLQPTLGTVAVAGAFLLSVPARRPLTRRLAADFCPLPEAFADHPGIQRLFLRLSLLWGLVYLVNAGTTLWLLVSQPLEVFLLAKTVLSTALTLAAIAGSVLWFRAGARRSGVLVVFRRRSRPGAEPALVPAIA